MCLVSGWVSIEAFGRVTAWTDRRGKQTSQVRFVAGAIAFIGVLALILGVSPDQANLLTLGAFAACVALGSSALAAGLPRALAPVEVDGLDPPWLRAVERWLERQLKLFVVVAPIGLLGVAMGAAWWFLPEENAERSLQGLPSQDPWYWDNNEAAETGFLDSGLCVLRIAPRVYVVSSGAESVAQVVVYGSRPNFTVTKCTVLTASRAS